MPAVDIRPPAVPTLTSSKADDTIGIHRILCVGKNYNAHVVEMGGDPKTNTPIFFLKPPTCYVPSGATIPYPTQTDNLHHEAELVVVIKTGGKDIAEENALNHVYGYASGNDLTRRDLQNLAKEKRWPWDMSKGFDNSAVIGTIHPVEEVGHLDAGYVRADVDGETRQDSDLTKLIWSVPEIISILSTYVELHPGDVIMTGTPSGVGPIAKGQTCTCEIEGLSPAVVTISA